DGVITGAYLQTPPFPVLLTELPDDALPPLMETLNPAQVNAERALAEKIGEIWRRRTGTEPEVERRTRLYRLGQLVPPDPAPSGRARVAVADDRELLFDWHHQFHREVGEEIGDRTTIIDDRISYGGLSLWEVDAVPVAMAGRTRVSAGMIRLGPVFTPVELRSRGYGAAVTAAVSATAQQLPNVARAAGDRHVRLARRRPGLRQRRVDAVGDERERGPALHGQRLARVGGQHEDRHVVRRVVAPPAGPRLVPRAGAAAEHLAPHDVRAVSGHDLGEDFRIRGLFAT